MSGLDKIISEILSRAQSEANALLEEARAQAEKIEQENNAVRAQAVAQIEQDASQKVAEIEAATQSAIQLQHRQGILEEKQLLISQTLEQALEKLHTLPDPDYFALLIRLAASNAEPGEGVLLLNSKDLARAPKDFPQQLAQALTENKQLTVSKESVDIDGGCILRYGNVDRNCSFESIFNTRRDEFRDTISEIIFA